MVHILEAANHHEHISPTELQQIGNTLDGNQQNKCLVRTAMRIAKSDSAKQATSEKILRMHDMKIKLQ